MVAARDLKCGNDVAMMAALGRYAEEFIIYGTSYLEDGMLKHRVTSDQNEIWQFVEACQKEALHPTVVTEWVNCTLVPSGERERYLLRSKISLAQRLKHAHSEAFMTQLAQFAQTPNNDDASPLLWQWQDELLGCFERERLELFRTLLQYAYDAKRLTQETYQSLGGWLAHVLAQMEDDAVIRKSFERTFYGVAYQAQGQSKYFVNAKKALVWQKRQQLMQEGKRTTPIWQKTYRYDYQPELLTTRQEFLTYIAQWFDKAYWQRLDAINALPSPISAPAYAHWLTELAQTKAPGLPTARYYQTSWGI